MTQRVDYVANGNGIPGGTSADPSYRCGEDCIGRFVGVHLCLRKRPGNTLTVYCLGDNGCQSSFRTRGLFNRHCNSLHHRGKLASGMKLLDCPSEGCSRVGKNGFTRRDNLLQHRRGVHGEDIAKVKVRFAGRVKVRNAKGNGTNQSVVNGSQYTSVVQSYLEE